jgi:hypothetical protein
MVRSHDGSSEKNANRSYRLTVFTMVVGGRVLPLLLAHVARMESRELFTLAHHRARDCHLGRRSLGVSMALGAFFAGLEVAIAWTTAVLEHLGATPEQIDRERKRMGTDLHPHS